MTILASLTAFSPRAIVNDAADQDRFAAPRVRAKMTKADIDTFRDRLLALRSRLNGDVSHLANEALKARGGEASA